MTLLEKLRSISFWTIDRIKGGEIKKALKLLDNCENGKWTEDEIAEYQKKAVKQLLNYAKENVPFYEKQSDTDLLSLPVMNKRILKENGKNIFSIEFKENELIHMYTSGSTGTPFECLQNVAKKRHVNAETLFYNGKIGYIIGRRIIYLRSIVGEVSKSKLHQFAENIYLLDCNDLSDEGIHDKLKFIVDYSKGCGAMLMGYASTLTAFQKYFDKYGIDEVKNAEIYGIASGSEMLYDSTRNTLEKAFKCKCVSRYANEENGFLGQDAKENNVFLMNRANYYIEILKMNEDIPADENEIGRIVVTDLYNYAMPMIRYDTGDIGSYQKINHNSIERLAVGNFGGRIVDTVMDTKGNLVSPHAITNTMWRYQQIKKFQFVQKDRDTYEMIIVLENENFDENELLDKIKNIFGDDAKIKITHCKNIPAMSSGKYRYIVNEQGGH